MASFDEKFDIFFEDISPSGMVHLEKIAEWMSMGREKFFRATCPKHIWLDEGEVAIFTVSMSISIKGSSKWSDTVKVSMTIFDIKKISYSVNFDFYNLRTNKIIANGIQKVAFLNKNTGKFTRIAEDINKVILNYIG